MKRNLLVSFVALTMFALVFTGCDDPTTVTPPAVGDDVVSQEFEVREGTGTAEVEADFDEGDFIVSDKDTGVDLFYVTTWDDSAEFTLALNTDGHVEITLVSAGTDTWHLPLVLLNETTGDKTLKMEAKSTVAAADNYPWFTGSAEPLSLTTEFTTIEIDYEHMQDTSTGDYWNLSYLGDGTVLTIKYFTITDKVAE